MLNPDPSSEDVERRLAALEAGIATDSPPAALDAQAVALDPHIGPELARRLRFLIARATVDNRLGLADKAVATLMEARRLAMAVCGQHGVPCAWGRIFLPFGPGEAPRRLIPSLIDVFAGKRAPFGVNAEACRDFLHASDVAEGFVALLHRGEGAFNISSGEPVRLANLVALLAEMLDADLRAVLDLPGGRPGEPSLLAGDNTKLKALGWDKRIALRDGLQEMIDEVRRKSP